MSTLRVIPYLSALRDWNFFGVHTGHTLDANASVTYPLQDIHDPKESVRLACNASIEDTRACLVSDLEHGYIVDDTVQWGFVLDMVSTTPDTDQAINYAIGAYGSRYNIEIVVDKTTATLYMHKRGETTSGSITWVEGGQLRVYYSYSGATNISKLFVNDVQIGSDIVLEMKFLVGFFNIGMEAVGTCMYSLTEPHSTANFSDTSNLMAIHKPSFQESISPVDLTMVIGDYIRDEIYMYDRSLASQGYPRWYFNTATPKTATVYFSFTGVYVLKEDEPLGLVYVGYGGNESGSGDTRIIDYTLRIGGIDQNIPVTTNFANTEVTIVDLSPYIEAINNAGGLGQVEFEMVGESNFSGQSHDCDEIWLFGTVDRDQIVDVTPIDMTVTSLEIKGAGEITLIEPDSQFIDITLNTPKIITARIDAPLILIPIAFLEPYVGGNTLFVPVQDSPMVVITFLDQFTYVFPESIYLPIKFWEDDVIIKVQIPACIFTHPLPPQRSFPYAELMPIVYIHTNAPTILCNLTIVYADSPLLHFTFPATVELSDAPMVTIENIKWNYVGEVGATETGDVIIAPPSISLPIFLNYIDTFNGAYIQAPLLAMELNTHQPTLAELSRPSSLMSLAMTLGSAIAVTNLTTSLPKRVVSIGDVVFDYPLFWSHGTEPKGYFATKDKAITGDTVMSIMPYRQWSQSYWIFTKNDIIISETVVQQLIAHVDASEHLLIFTDGSTQIVKYDLSITPVSVEKATNEWYYANIKVIF